MAVKHATSDAWRALTGCFILEAYGLTEGLPSHNRQPLQFKKLQQ